jgi:ribosomal protein L37AE/L43A
MDSGGMTNPLNVDDLLEVRSVYRSIVLERPHVFEDFPTDASWIRFRYLPSETTTVMASLTYADAPTLSIHPEAFRFDSHLLRGLIHHELLHVLLGHEEGHGALFTTLESSWKGWSRYRPLRRRFNRHLQTLGVGVAEFTYRCLNCDTLYHVKRPLRPESACRKCCKAFNGGKWCETYPLIKVERPRPIHAEA